MNGLANIKGGQGNKLSLRRTPMPARNHRAQKAFSLLEVMVAIAIFFMAAFAILTLVSGALRNARMLERPQVDAGAVASALSITNRIVEGTASGDLGDLRGDTYRGYTWETSSIEVQSNRLFQVDITVLAPTAGHPVFSKVSLRLFRPESPPGILDGGLGIH
jgi:type II secretory pathway pseudopilin PulG